MIYMSPERIFRNAYSYAGDIWSLGLIVIELATGVYAYPKLTNFIEMVEYLQNMSPPQLPDNGLYSSELRHFISLCMQKEPENRATVTQLLDHPWLRLHENSSADLIGWYKSVLK
jgi:serine/threonine protein kinase